MANGLLVLPLCTSWFKLNAPSFSRMSAATGCPPLLAVGMWIPLVFKAIRWTTGVFVRVQNVFFSKPGDLGGYIALQVRGIRNITCTRYGSMRRDNAELRSILTSYHNSIIFRFTLSFSLKLGRFAHVFCVL